MLKEETIANLYSFYRMMGGYIDGVAGDFNSLSFIKSDDGWPSQLFGEANVDDALLEEVIAGMQEGSLPAKWVREKSDDDFDARALNLSLREIMRWKGMGLKVSQSEEKHRLTQTHLRHSSEKRYSFVKLHKKEQLKKWIDPVNEVLLSSEELNTALFDKLLDADKLSFFALEEEREMPSVMAAFEKAGVVGMYLVATRKEDQGKGYGSFLLGEVLNYYISRGIFKFVLHATTAGVHLYRKFGFEENSQIGVYWLMGKR